MAIIRGGRPFYGNALGILVLNTTYPAFPGNVANATSYSFPVRFKVMDIPTDWWCDKRGPDEERFQIYLKAAKELEAEGVKAITSGCGFFAVYQKRAARELNIPLFASPLLMVPMISRMIGENKKVGIVTAGGKHLKEGAFLKEVGIDESVKIAVKGMENSDEFWKVILEQSKPDVDTEKFEKEVVTVAKELLAENPDIGAFVFECSDLPPCAKAVSQATGLPVFDFITLAHLVYNATFPKSYEGFM